MAARHRRREGRQADCGTLGHGLDNAPLAINVSGSSLEGVS